MHPIGYKEKVCPYSHEILHDGISTNESSPKKKEELNEDQHQIAALFKNIDWNIILIASNAD